jgi:hypothetical protein
MWLVIKGKHRDCIDMMGFTKLFVSLCLPVRFCYSSSFVMNCMFFTFALTWFYVILYRSCWEDPKGTFEFSLNRRSSFLIPKLSLQDMKHELLLPCGKWKCSTDNIPYQFTLEDDEYMNSCILPTQPSLTNDLGTKDLKWWARSAPAFLILKLNSSQ